MNKLLPKTFLWMFFGLLVTFLTGYIVSINTNMIEAIFSGVGFWIIIILELALVIFFSARVKKMSPTTAKICFLLYSFISGLTFSSVFLAFEIGSVIYVFLVSALIFGLFGLLGYYTKLDLSKFGTYLLMALVAVLVCFIINIFVKSETFDLIVTIITLLVFIGFTAYDVNKIKKLADSGVDNEVVAIHGALQLYLDFINIFLHLLQLIGDAKN